MTSRMRLVVARDALLERILDDTYPLWHDGLTREGYGRLNAAQMRTPWGGAHLHRVALVDDAGAPLSSAKRYRLQAQMDGRLVRICGIGAVFTPPGLRGRGHASALIEQLVDEERANGAVAALLFSAIGSEFYERLAFRSIAVDEVTLGVTRGPGAPAMLVRGGVDADLPAVASMHEARSGMARFALCRDTGFIQYSLARKRLRAGLARQGARQVEFHVAEEGAAAAAYVILSINEHGWTLDEAGDRDPAGARVGAMLQVLLAREPSVAPPAIRAWWPRAFPVPPQLSLSGRHDARDVLMVRALAEVVLPSDPSDVFYWRGDVF
jgi:GNAT superfamily N-acetyltransferase